MLTEERVLDLIQITETCILLERYAHYVLRDGVRISTPTYERAAYDPGADVSRAHPTVQAIAQLLWTPEVLAAAEARRAAASVALPGA